MAAGFNLTAQLNLKGPTNVSVIVADIKKQLGSINASVNLTVAPTAAKNIAQLNTILQSFNQTLTVTTTNATATANAIRNLGTAIGSINAASLPQTLNSAASATNKLAQASANSAKQLAASTTEMTEFGKQSGLAIRRFAAFSTVTGVVYGLSNAINNGIRAYIDYDRQLVKLQQVTGQSAAGLKGLENTITSLATGLGVGSAELTEISSTLAQAGLSARDTERALKALALSSLAPSFDSMNETVEGSIALMRQFGINAGDLEKALGSVNSVAAKFAVEAADLITAIQRTGGVFATASKGVSEGTDALNEFLAVFTSIRATTRESAETIATGLRTIFTRIQRGDTIQALKEYGVNLQDLDGKFVGAYKAVELLSKGLGSLDPRDLRFSKIVEELGGFRQIGKVIPLIQQFATAQDALKVAQTGQGSLAGDAVKAQQALAVQISKVREEFLALFREIGQSDSFQAIAKGALSVTSALIKAADSIKGVLPVLGVMLAFKGASAAVQFSSGFLSGVRGSGGARGLGNRMGGGPGGMSSGGVVRRFAAGGLVPGSGDADSIDAKLTPGEFVMSKPAVKAIGASNLNNMNRGGSIRRFTGGGDIQRFADGSWRGVSAQIRGGRGRPSKDTTTVGEAVDKIQSKTYDNRKGRFKSDFPFIIRGLNRSGTKAAINEGVILDKYLKKGVDDLSQAIVSQTQNNITVPSGDTPIQNKESIYGGLFETALLKISKKSSDKKDNNQNFDFPKGIGKTLSGIFSGMPPDISTDVKRTAAANAAMKSNIANKIANDMSTGSKPKVVAPVGVVSLSPMDSAIVSKIPGTEVNSLLNKKLKQKGATTRSKNRKARQKEDLYYDDALENAIWSSYSDGGSIKKFAVGGMAIRNVGYIDGDVLNDSSNMDVVRKEMERLKITDVHKYKSHLSNMAAMRRRSGDLGKLSTVYGVAGSGKSTFVQGGARAKEADNAKLRKTNRYPILTEADILRSDSVIDSTSVVGPNQKASLAQSDRIINLSSRTQESQNVLIQNRKSRDLTGVGLFGRKAGATKGASLDSGAGEAYMAAKEVSGIDQKKIVTYAIGPNFSKKRTNQPTVRTPEKTAVFSGNVGPTTAGHVEAVMQGAKKSKVRPEDTVIYVAGNTPVDPFKRDDQTERTAILPQTSSSGPSRVGMARAAFGAKGFNVAAAPKGVAPGSLPSAFKIGDDSYIVPKSSGNVAYMGDDKPKATTDRYRSQGYEPMQIARDGISGTAARAAIMSNDIEAMKKLLTPEGIAYLKPHMAILQKRPKLLDSILARIQENAQKGKGRAGRYSSTLAELSILPARVTAKTPTDIATRVKDLRGQRDIDEAVLGRRAGRMLPKLERLSKSSGGSIRKFADAGVVTPTAGKKATTSEIIKLVGLETAAKVGGISALDVYSTLNKRTPTPEQAASKAAILAEFTKKQNRLSGAKEARTTRITSKGLLFGAAGMLGSSFQPINKKIISNQLKAPVDVRIVSGIMDPAVASSVGESFNSSLDKASGRAAKKVMIADILAKTGLGKELNLDFDRTLAFGADKILSDPKTPKFAEFGDRNKVAAALKGARLSILGKELASLVSSKPELLSNLKLITARPSSTLDLVQGWLSSKGLPIPLSQFKGLGGPGVSGSQIAKLKAQLLTPGSLFVDDDARNIKAAKGRAKEGITAYRYGNRKISRNPNAEATAQGTLFEKMIQKLGGPGALKGQGMDFPQGLKGAAKYFGIPANIATDAKRTISGPSTLEDNIITYLKVKGYNLGGLIQKFAAGGKVDYYSLEKNSGFNSREFDLLVNFAKTNGLSLEDFKKYLAQRSAYKQQNSGLRMNPASVLRAITPEAPRTTDKQRALADQLKGEPDAGYRPILTGAQRIASDRLAVQKATRGFSDGGTIRALVSNGEAYVPPETAKEIGYPTLHKMNQADRNGMDKFSRGGISVFRGPGSGTSDSIGPIALPVGSFILREKATKALGLSSGGSVQSFSDGGGIPLRPETVSSTSIKVDKNITDSLQELAQVIRSLGIKSSESSKLLRSGSDISYQAAEDAIKADVKRLRLSAASSDQIIKAEQKLADVRSQKQRVVSTQQDLKAVFDAGATNISRPGVASNTLLSSRKSLDVGSLNENPYAVQQAIELEAQALRARYTKRMEARGVDTSTDNFKQKAVSQSYLIATEKITGTPVKDLRARGLSGGDIERYIKSSMQDRKALAEMDKQYRVIRTAELQAANKTASEAKKLVEQELRDRRASANAIARERGLSGPGGTGISGSIGYGINKTANYVGGLGNRFSRFIGTEVDDSGRSTFTGSKSKGIMGGIGNTIGAVGSTANKLAGGTSFATMMALSAISGQGENIAGFMGGDKRTRAGNAANVESGVATFSAGLALTGQAAMMSGPFAPLVAGVGLAVTSIAAWKSGVEASKKALKAYDDNLRSQKAEDANEALSKAFDALAKDVNNLNLKDKLNKRLKESIETNNATSGRVLDEKKEEIRSKQVGSMSSYEYIGTSIGSFLPEILGGLSKEDNIRTRTISSRDLSSSDYQELARKQQPRYESARQVAIAQTESAMGKGATVDQVQADKVFEPIREAIARSNLDTLAKLLALDARETEERGKATKATTQTEKERAKTNLEGIARQKASIINEGFRQSQISQTIQKTIDFNNAIETSNKAIRQLTLTFGILTKAFSQSINSISFKLNNLEDSFNNFSNALGGKAEIGQVRSKDAIVLANPLAFTPIERQDTSRRVARGMFDPNAAGISLAEKKQREQSASDVEKILNADVASIANRTAAAGSSRNKGQKEEFGNTANAMRAALEQQTQNLPEQMKNELLAAFDSIKKGVEDDAKGNPRLETGEAKSEELIKQIQDKLGSASSEAAESIKKAGIEYADSVASTLNKFLSLTNRAVQAQLKAIEFRNRASDIRTEGNISLREQLSGGSIGLAERGGVFANRISRMTGGITDPTAIRQNIDNKTKELEKQQNELQGKVNSAQNEEQRVKITEDATRSMAQLTQEINNSQQALEEMANSTELATAAMDNLQSLQKLQAERLQNVDQVLTSTPQELRKLNESLIRVQQRAMGINPGPSQAARQAYGTTLRQTGNRALAMRAGQAQMAQDRATDLNTMQQYGGQYELMLRNSINPATGKEYTEIEARQNRNVKTANVRGQMAFESGAAQMYGNPLLNAIMSGVDPRRDASVRDAVNGVAQANDLQGRANEEKAVLAEFESKRALATATQALTLGFKELSNTLNIILSKLSPEAQQALGIVVPQNNARQAVARAVGGMIYAAGGDLIDFKPQGTDTVPAMLTPGEFVINARATAKHLPILTAINNGANLVGNTPMMSRGGVVYLASGGRTRKDLNDKLEAERNEARTIVADVEARTRAYNAPDNEERASDEEDVRLAIDRGIHASIRKDLTGASGLSEKSLNSAARNAAETRYKDSGYYINGKFGEWDKLDEKTQNELISKEMESVQAFANKVKSGEERLGDWSSEYDAWRKINNETIDIGHTYRYKKEEYIKPEERRRLGQINANRDQGLANQANMGDESATTDRSLLNDLDLVENKPNNANRGRIASNAVNNALIDAGIPSEALNHPPGGYTEYHKDGVNWTERMAAEQAKPDFEDRAQAHRAVIEERERKLAEERLKKANVTPEVDPAVPPVAPAVPAVPPVAPAVPAVPPVAPAVPTVPPVAPAVPAVPQKAFRKPRNMGEVELFHEGLARGMTIDEIKNERRNRFLARTGKPKPIAQKPANPRAQKVNSIESDRLSGRSWVVDRAKKDINDDRSMFEEKRREIRSKNPDATDEEVFNSTVDAVREGYSHSGHDANWWRNQRGVSAQPNTYDESNTLDVIRNDSNLSTRDDPTGEKTRAYIDSYSQSQSARKQSDRVDRGMGRLTDPLDTAVVGTQGPATMLNWLIDKQEVGRAVKHKEREARFDQENKEREKIAARHASLDARDKELGINTSDINRDMYGDSYQPGMGRKISIEEQKQKRREKVIAARFSFTDKTGKHSTTGTIDKVDLDKGTVRIAKIDPKTGEPVTKFDLEKGEQQVYTTVPLDKLSDESREKARSHGLAKEADKAKAGESFKIGDSSGKHTTSGKIFRVDEKAGTVVIQKDSGKMVTVPLERLAPESRNIALDQAKTGTTVTDLTQKQIDADVANIDISSSLPEPPVPLAEDFTDRANQIRQETMTNLAMEQSRLDSSEQLPEVAPSRRAIDPVTGRIMGPKSDHPSIDAQAESELKIDRKFKLKDTEARYQELRTRSKAESAYDGSWLGENWPKEWGGVSKPEKRLTRKELEELGRMESERGVPFTSRLGANVTAEQTRRESGLEEAQIESLSQQETKQFQTQLEKDKDSEGGEAVGLAAQRAVVPLVVGATAIAAAPAVVPLGLAGAGLTLLGGVGASLGANKLQDMALEGTDFDKRQRELAEKRPGATAVGSLLPGLLTGNPLTGANTIRQALTMRAVSGATEAALGAGIRGATSGGDFGTVQDVGMDFISGAILPSANFGSKGTRNYTRPEGPAKPTSFNDIAAAVKAEQLSIREENVLAGTEIIATKRKQEEARRVAQAEQKVRDEAEAVKEAGREKAVFDFMSPLVTKPNDPSNTSPTMRAGASLLDKIDTEFRSAAVLGQAGGSPSSSGKPRTGNMVDRILEMIAGSDQNTGSLSATELTTRLTEAGMDPKQAEKAAKQRSLQLESDVTVMSAKQRDALAAKLDAEHSVSKAKEEARLREELTKDADFEYQQRINGSIDGSEPPITDPAQRAEVKKQVTEEYRQKLKTAIAEKEQAFQDSRAAQLETVNTRVREQVIPSTTTPEQIKTDAATEAAAAAATTSATKPKPESGGVFDSTEPSFPQSEILTTPQPNKNAADTVTAGTKPVENPSIPTDRSLGFFQQKGDSRWFNNPDAIKTRKDLYDRGEISGATGYKTRFTPKPGQLDVIKGLIAKDPELASMVATLKTNEDFLVLYSTRGNAEQAAAINARMEQLAGDKLVEGGAISYGDNIPLGKYGSARFDPDNGGVKAEYIDTLYDKMKVLVKDKKFTDNNPEFTKAFEDSRNEELRMIPRMKLNNPNAKLDIAKIVYNVGDYIKKLPEDIQTHLYRDIPEFEGNDLSRQVKSAQEAQRASVETATRDATSTPTKPPIAGDEFELGPGDDFQPENVLPGARAESQAREAEAKLSSSTFEKPPENALKESELGRVDASSPEVLKAGKEAQRARRRASRSKEENAVINKFGPQYRAAKKANDRQEMYRIKKLAEVEFQRRKQSKNGFGSNFAKILGIFGPTGAALGYGLGSLLTGSTSKKKEQSQDPASRLKNASTLQEVYDLVSTNDRGSEGFSAVEIAMRLREIDPERYDRGGEEYVNLGELAGMPDDSYSAYLDRLKDNAIEAQATAESKGKVPPPRFGTPPTPRFSRNVTPIPSANKPQKKQQKKPVNKARGGLIYASEGMRIPGYNPNLDPRLITEDNSGAKPGYTTSAEERYMERWRRTHFDLLADPSEGPGLLGAPLYPRLSAGLDMLGNIGSAKAAGAKPVAKSKPVVQKPVTPRSNTTRSLARFGGELSAPYTESAAEQAAKVFRLGNKPGIQAPPLSVEAKPAGLLGGILHDFKQKSQPDTSSYRRPDQIVYHGSGASFDKVDMSKAGDGMLGSGFYAGFGADPESIASNFARMGIDKHIRQKGTMEGFGGGIYPVRIKGGISDFANALTPLSENRNHQKAIQQIFAKEQIDTSNIDFDALTFRGAQDMISDQIARRIEPQLSKNIPDTRTESLRLASQRVRGLMSEHGIPGSKDMDGSLLGQSMISVYDDSRTELGRPMVPDYFDGHIKETLARDKARKANSVNKYATGGLVYASKGSLIPQVSPPGKDIVDISNIENNERVFSSYSDRISSSGNPISDSAVIADKVGTPQPKITPSSTRINGTIKNVSAKMAQGKEVQDIRGIELGEHQVAKINNLYTEAKDQTVPALDKILDKQSISKASESISNTVNNISNVVKGINQQTELIGSIGTSGSKELFAQMSPQAISGSINNNSPQYKAGGGIVYASNGTLVAAKSVGTDTVPAMLTPGEFVVNRQATQQHMPILQAINSGAYNQGGVVKYLAEGGIVAPQYYAGGGLAKMAGGAMEAFAGMDMSAIKELAGSLADLKDTFGSLENVKSLGDSLQVAVNTMGTNISSFGEQISSIPSQVLHNVSASVTQHVTGLGDAGRDILAQATSNASIIAQSATSTIERNRFKSEEGQGSHPDSILGHVGGGGQATV